MKLIVERLEFDTTEEFTDPEALSRASEGFCPFPFHYRPNDPDGCPDPVKLLVLPDGTVECDWRKGEYPRSVMRFRWIPED